MWIGAWDIISYTSATFHTHSYPYIVNIIILYGLGHNYLSPFASPILMFCIYYNSLRNVREIFFKKTEFNIQKT